METYAKLWCGLATLGWITLPSKHFLSSVGDSCRRSGVLDLSGTTARSTTRRLRPSYFDGDLRQCQALLDFAQRPSRLWSILEVDSADAQREVAARCSERGQEEGKGGGGEVPFYSSLRGPSYRVAND